MLPFDPRSQGLEQKHPRFQVCSTRFDSIAERSPGTQGEGKGVSQMHWPWHFEAVI